MPLYEELITEGEGIVETSHEKIMVLQGNGLTCEELGSFLHQPHQKAKGHDRQGIVDILQKLIPEYRPERTRN